MKLAEKYAPKTWDELVGQPELHEIESGRMQK